VQFIIQLAWQLFNTGLMCFILTKLLYKPVLKFLNDRKEKVAKQIDSAQQQLAEAEALRIKYEGKLKDIDAERDDILDKARDRAKQSEAEIIERAKKEAETIKSRAMLDIQRAEEKAKDDMKKEIIEISSLMASRFVAASMNEEEQNKLVNEVISGLGEVKWQN